ncbi:MAG: hypothetical protein B6U89_01185 [Desulfurococcales archaeon ex4484_58]|nr:MAG: hypothetical protein B6U89_01185 [Desulfurococcales archaeon ex4484_58]
MYMKSRLMVYKAILWLHITRLERYKYGFLNMILIDVMWYLIFLLGALMFVPSNEYLTIAVITFWGIVLWVIMNNSVWLIAGWTWFALASGLVEEHFLYNVNPLIFIAGRFLTGISVTLATIPVVLTIFSSIAGSYIFYVYSPVYLGLGMILMLIYSTLYSLILVALSLRTSVPGVMLDVFNIFMYVGGGIGVPVARMPEALRYFALAMPYTHAAEILRYGVLGLKPYYGLENELIIASIYIIVLATITYIVIKIVMKYVRRHGVRAIGIM